MPEEKFQGDLRALRAEKESMIGNRRRIDDDLTTLNQSIKKMVGLKLMCKKRAKFEAFSRVEFSSELPH